MRQKLALYRVVNNSRLRHKDPDVILLTCAPHSTTTAHVQLGRETAHWLTCKITAAVNLGCWLSLEKDMQVYAVLESL